VENIAIEGRAQRFGAGEHADQRHLGRDDHLQVLDPRGRANVADQREDLVLLDEFPARERGDRRLVAVVLGDQADLAAMDAALGVDVVQVDLDAVVHLNAELGSRSAEDCRLAEDDRVRRHAGLGSRRRG
jgi:hypothetical protein